MSRNRWSPAVLLLALTGCVSGGATSGQDWEVGPATAVAVEREVEPILLRNGYEIYRVERYQSRIQIETEWVRREPFPEESAVGVVDARQRFVITTRPRGVTNSAGSTVSGVTLRLEVQHLLPDEPWKTAVVEAPQALAVGKRIADALRVELQVKGMQGG